MKKKQLNLIRPLTSLELRNIYESAHFHKRLIAFFLDGFILLTFNALFQAIIKILTPLYPHVLLENLHVFSTSLILFLNLIYFQMLTYRTGQTLGKKIVKIRIVSTYTSEMSFFQSWIRTLGYFISFFSFGIGFLSSLWEKDKKCWHDIVAGTEVIDLEHHYQNENLDYQNEILKIQNKLLPRRMTG
ncbi:MAG: RDD family protein [Deltaproteobacteria bacterium]|nr:RDD family protein [Deltaproteobacteria bacterium]